MLFNSIEFLVFLPITLALFLYLKLKDYAELALGFLVIASLFFYGWWNPTYLLLILPSIIFNYLCGKQLSATGANYKKPLLFFSVAINLFSIGYFKYSNFFLENINAVTNSTFAISEIILPLAISFFTFQQIAYLVDSYKGITKEYNFTHYILFVSFFPQLIAGPIVHHKDMLPQFSNPLESQKIINNITVGISIFAIGLFKKTVLADGIAQYANPVFNLAHSSDVDFFTAWGGALAYTFQLYFDFSGYSDMAIGIARMFGIVLPLNFYSPYKAVNISEFWRRWHITLSTFLRDYVYIPLGGNRLGQFKRYQNLLITMLLGGLWHGAGWNFIIWGGLHGAYLSIHQIWASALPKREQQSQVFNGFKKTLAWMTTFIAVVFAWVFFRATDLASALNIISGMLGMNGISIPNAIYARLEPLHTVFSSLNIEPNLQGGSDFVYTWLWVIALGLVSLLLPNVKQIFENEKPALTASTFANHAGIFSVMNKNLLWEDNKRWAIICGFLFAVGLMTLGQVSEFLYFQF